MSRYRIAVREKEKFGGKKMATKEKNIWILLIFILSGLVVGGLLGELASKVDWLWWLSYSQSFGLENPIVLDLRVMKITFALMFKISVASIIGMLLSIFVYRKVCRYCGGHKSDIGGKSYPRSNLCF